MIYTSSWWIVAELWYHAVVEYSAIANFSSMLITKRTRWGDEWCKIPRYVLSNTFSCSDGENKEYEKSWRAIWDSLIPHSPVIHVRISNAIIQDSKQMVWHHPHVQEGNTREIQLACRMEKHIHIVMLAMAIPHTATFTLPSKLQFSYAHIDVDFHFIPNGIVPKHDSAKWKCVYHCNVATSRV